jgi:hypothetical protein
MRPEGLGKLKKFIHVIGSGTRDLIVGNSRVRVPMRSLNFFSSNLPNPSSCTVTLAFPQLLTEMSKSKVKQKVIPVTGRGDLFVCC